MGGPNHGHNGDGQGFYGATPGPHPMYGGMPNNAYNMPPNPDAPAPPISDIPAPSEEMVANCFHQQQGWMREFVLFSMVVVCKFLGSLICVVQVNSL